MSQCMALLILGLTSVGAIGWHAYHSATKGAQLFTFRLCAIPLYLTWLCFGCFARPTFSRCCRVTPSQVFLDHLRLPEWFLVKNRRLWCLMELCRHQQGECFGVVCCTRGSFQCFCVSGALLGVLHLSISNHQCQGKISTSSDMTTTNICLFWF